LQGIEEESGEAFEVYGPEGEGDEEPVVDVPDGIGMGGGGDSGFEGEESLQQRGAMGFAAEGQG